MPRGIPKGGRLKCECGSCPICKRRVNSMRWYLRHREEILRPKDDTALDRKAVEVWDRITSRELDHEPRSGALRSSFNLITDYFYF